MNCSTATARIDDEDADLGPYGGRGDGGQSDLANPGLNGVTIRSDIGGRFDRIAAKQLSCPVKQCAHFV